MFRFRQPQVNNRLDSTNLEWEILESMDCVLFTLQLPLYNGWKDGWMDEEKEQEFQQDLPPYKTVLYILPNTLKVGGTRISAIKNSKI